MTWHGSHRRCSIFINLIQICPSSMANLPIHTLDLKSNKARKMLAEPSIPTKYAHLRWPTQPFNCHTIEICPSSMATNSHHPTPQNNLLQDRPKLPISTHKLTKLRLDTYMYICASQLRWPDRQADQLAFRAYWISCQPTRSKICPSTESMPPRPEGSWGKLPAKES